MFLIDSCIKHGCEAKSGKHSWHIIHLLCVCVVFLIVFMHFKGEDRRSLADILGFYLFLWCVCLCVFSLSLCLFCVSICVKHNIICISRERTGKVWQTFSARNTAVRKLELQPGREENLQPGRGENLQPKRIHLMRLFLQICIFAILLSENLQSGGGGYFFLRFNPFSDHGLNCINVDCRL